MVCSHRIQIPHAWRKSERNYSINLEPSGGLKISFELVRFELSGLIYMQISTKGNGNLVRVNGDSSYPRFELKGLYCNQIRLRHMFYGITTNLQPKINFIGFLASF